MNDSELGHEWDVSYEPSIEDDVIFIDVGDAGVYLTASDLDTMRAHLT